MYIYKYVSVYTYIYIWYVLVCYLCPGKLPGVFYGGGPGPSWARPYWAPPGPSWARPLRSPLLPCGPAWALVGQALMGSLGPHGLGPCGPPWAHMGTYGPGSCGPPWALSGRALMGPLVPHGLGPKWPPWVLVGWDLMGPTGLWCNTPQRIRATPHYVLPFDHTNEKPPYKYVHTY